jgi:DNA invertase Pin-like site-specific DNA recombinase
MVTLNLLPDALKTGLLVSDILSTYALPERRLCRIRRIAQNRFRERPDLAAIYRFIDAMVERGIMPEDFFTSLDLDSLPARSRGPDGSNEAAEETPLSYGELERALARRLGNPALGMLRSVLLRIGISPDHPSPVSESELAHRIADVSRRLRRLAERVQRTGVLVPGPRIGRVSFRGRQLFEIRGRYHAKVTDEVAVKIFEAHVRGLSLAAAARFAGVSKDTVRRWWARAGKKPNRRPYNETDPDVIRRVLEGHRKYRGSAEETARHAGVSPSTVYRYWKKAGLLPPAAASRLPRDAVEKIRAAFRPHGGNATQAARALGLSPSTVRKYWKRQGLQPRHPGRPRSGKKRKGKGRGRGKG